MNIAKLAVLLVLVNVSVCEFGYFVSPVALKTPEAGNNSYDVDTVCHILSVEVFFIVANHCRVMLN
jgi:hypothetical protein